MNTTPLDLTKETKPGNCACNQLVAELSALNEQLGIDFDNSEREVRRLRRVVTNREKEIKRLKGEQIVGHAEEIQTVIEEWARLTGRTGRHAPKHKTRGERAEMVAARLENDKFTVEELLEAVRWLAEFPNAGPRGRVPAGSPGSRRFDELKYALESEVRVQEILRKIDEPVPEAEPEKPSKPLRLAPPPKMRHEGIDDVLAALTARGCAWRPAGAEHWMAQCCVHEDRTPSLSISVKNGKVLVSCLGCQAGAAEVREVLDLPWAVFMEASGA